MACKKSYFFSGDYVLVGC